VEIVDAKLGAGTVTLSMAWSAHKFANSVLRALAGSQDVIEVAYVQSNVSKTRYFSNPLKLGVSHEIVISLKCRIIVKNKINSFLIASLMGLRKIWEWES
jgi:malate/lactate dehydrogenase